MPASLPVFSTSLTKVFGINHPVMLAGMDVAAGPRLAATVTNSGGIGVIGGVLMTPRILEKTIQELKEHLEDKNGPFGVDLLLPQVGGGARATNKDYTNGQLPELIDVIIRSKPKLFVSAVGVPPKWVVDKLHGAGILIMNMIGHPKHVRKCAEAGIDLVCAQGGEGGGHTGETPFSILIPAVVDEVKRLGARSPLTGEPMTVVAAGGVYDGRGLAAALSYGAAGVWVGTRFLASEEGGAPHRHKEAVVNAGYDDIVRTTVWTGRPVNAFKSPYIMEWETTRQQEHKALLEKGKIPFERDVERDPSLIAKIRPLPMGRVSGSIRDIKPGKVILDDIVFGAAKVLKDTNKLIKGKL